MEPKKAKKFERGVALVMVLLVVMILTITTLEFHFESQVDLQITVGKRDGFKAYLIAASGIRVAEKLLFEQFLAGKDPVTLDDVPSLNMISRVLSQACANAAQNSGAPGIQDTLDKLPINVSAGGISTGCEEPDTLPVVELYKFAEIGEGDSLDISFEDEDSKINLNALVNQAGKVNFKQRRLLEAFLLSALLDPETGAPEKTFVELGGYRDQEFTPLHLASSIIDWMDEDTTPLDGGGFEENYYNYPYPMKNNPFETLNELRLVKGVPEFALLERLGCYFTVYSGSAQINVNRAPLPILKAMVFAAFSDEANPIPFEAMDMVNEIVQEIDLRRQQTPLVQLMAKFMECPFEPPEAECGNGPFKIKGSNRKASQSKEGLVGFLNCLQKERQWVEDPKIWSQFATSLNKLSKTTSRTFRVRATAKVNGVTSIVSTIVRNSQNGLERLYWREEPMMDSGVWQSNQN